MRKGQYTTKHCSILRNVTLLYLACVWPWKTEVKTHYSCTLLTKISRSMCGQLLSHTNIPPSSVARDATISLCYCTLEALWMHLICVTKLHNIKHSSGVFF